MGIVQLLYVLMILISLNHTIFGGYDIFELLVEWNKDHLEEIYDQLEENAAKQYGENNRHKFWGSQYRDIAIAYQNGDMDKVEELIKQLPSQQQHDEWMRDIGISIDKEWIPYPIKIVSNVRGIKKYKDLPVSHYTQ